MILAEVLFPKEKGRRLGLFGERDVRVEPGDCAVRQSRGRAGKEGAGKRNGSC